MSRQAPKAVLAIVLLAFFAIPAAAQGAVAVIEYASGDDVTIIRASKSVLVDDVLGFELMQGDQVQTGRGVFLELRMLAGGAVLKLSEHTTFVMRAIAGGQTSLALVYGRIRAKVEKLAGTDSFSISSESAVAGVRGTDFGMDIIAPRGSAESETSTRVYCFEGSVDVTALVDSAVSSAEALEPVRQSFLITAGEMVVVSRSQAKRQAKKSVIDDAIRAFWKANDFGIDTQDSQSISPQTEATPTAVATAPSVTDASATGSDTAAVYDGGYSAGYGTGYLEGQAAAPASLDGYLSLEESERIRRASQAQKGGLIISGIMAMAGAGLSGTGLYLMSDGQSLMADYMLQGGIILSAVSLPFLIFALFQGK